MRRPTYSQQTPRGSILRSEAQNTERLYPGAPLGSFRSGQYEVQSPHYHSTPELLSPQTSKMERTSQSFHPRYEDVMASSHRQRRQPIEEQQMPFQDLHFDERNVMNLVMQMPSDEILTGKIL